jgi:esterase
MGEAARRLNYQLVEPRDGSASSDGGSAQAALVIVHGLFGSGDNWMSLGRTLARHRPVALVDLPNHGASPWTDSARYADMALHLDLTLEDIARTCGRRRLALLGHSMGGKLAMQLALMNSRRSADQGSANGAYELSSLIVADIAPKAYPPGHTEYFETMSDLPLNELQTRGDADRMMASRIPEKLLRAFLLKNLAKDENGNFRWKLNLPLLISDYPHILGWDGEGLSSIPALFLRGERSDYVSLPRDGDVIRSLFPSARIETIGGAGHWLHAEQPESVIRAIQGFLEE